MWKSLLSVSVVVLLAGCTSVSVESYSGRDPAFDPQVFFNGPLTAEGVVLSRGGKVNRYFTATIDASWDDRGGRLDEAFQWNDGDTQTRLWRFEKIGDRHYEGRAGDVVGAADMRYAGNAVNMDYVLEVPLSNGRTIQVHMDDWLYQVSDDTLINVTDMTKFGFRVGRVVLTMKRVEVP